MKKTIYFLLSLIFFVSCYDDGDLRKQLQDLEDRVANLAGTVIASINDQVTGVEKSLEELDLMDAELQGYIADLEAYAKDLEKRLAALDAVAEDVEDIESELAAVREAIEVLKESDDDLDERTADLKSYVDDTLKSSKDWAESTFATLAQYDTLQTEISMIKSTVEQLSDEIVTMEADFGQDLSAAIAATETGIKTWVNEQLALSYYDAASINVKLDELEKAYQDADAALQTKIEDQQKALDQAKEDLTEEYKKALSDAIGSNGGVIDAKIAEAIKTAQDALKSQIDDINTIVNELEDRLAVLESNLAGRIQNMSYVPEYADGKVTMLEGEGRFGLKFLVKPEKLATEIQDLWEIDNKVVKANLFYSKHPVTKSDLDAVVPLTVLSLEASADGYIDVLIGVHPEHPLLEDFWDGEVPALTYVHISDGNNDFATDMVVLEGQRGGYSEIEPEPEPSSDDYIDEYGVNHGPGIKIGETIWAPVNCGYHATDYQWGKLYQWGRKYGQGYAGALYAGTTQAIGEISDAEIPELVAGPVTLAVGQSSDNASKFYYGLDNPYDWLDYQNDNLWNSGTEALPVKTEYDPCPSGWRVPTDAELEALVQNFSDMTSNAAGQYGYWFSGDVPYSEQAQSVFFPAAGYRDRDGADGYSRGRGLYGEYWSSCPYTHIYHSGELSFSGGGVNVSSYYRAGGCAVRCVKE